MSHPSAIAIFPAVGKVAERRLAALDEIALGTDRVPSPGPRADLPAHVDAASVAALAQELETEQRRLEEDLTLVTFGKPSAPQPPVPWRKQWYRGVAALRLLEHAQAALTGCVYVCIYACMY